MPEPTSAPTATASSKAVTTAPAIEPAAGFQVEHYDPSRACNGTTYFADTHDPSRPRIVEVSMEGEILWEYAIPQEHGGVAGFGLDIEVHPDCEAADGGASTAGVAIQYVIPGSAVVMIDRSGRVMASHTDSAVRYDADRLDTGNTVYALATSDSMDGPQVREVSRDGETVWEWSASGHLTDLHAWPQANDVRRLWNNHTVINLPDLARTIEVDREGQIVWQFDWTALYPGLPRTQLRPYAPEMQGNDQMLVCFYGNAPHQAIEIERPTGSMVWHYHREGLAHVSDCDRVCHGNVLMVGVLNDTQESVITEVTWGGDIVWQLTLKDAPTTDGPGWFYKAQRISP
jgi:hypothetical protein